MGWAGAAMTVAGAAMQIAAAQQANNAMGAQYRNQINAQKGYRNQASSALTPLIGQSAVKDKMTGQSRYIPGSSSTQVADKQIAEGSASRQAGYARTTTPMATPTYASQTSPQDMAYAKLTGGARANLGGYSDWALRQSMSNLEAQRIMDQATNFAQGAAGVFPLQMYEAQHSKDRLAMAGQFLGSMGSFMPTGGGGPKIKGEPGSVG